MPRSTTTGTHLRRRLIQLLFRLRQFSRFDDKTWFVALVIAVGVLAALVSRGLVEITRLGVAMGGRRETFSGLAGLGDLVTTCISPHGRNRSLGEAIGKGKTLQQAQAATDSVAEGVATTRSVLELARRHHVEMPIAQAVNDVLFDRREPRDAIADLMSRRPKRED